MICDNESMEHAPRSGKTSTSRSSGSADHGGPKYGDTRRESKARWVKKKVKEGGKRFMIDVL